MSSISSLTPSGTASARLGTGAGAGDPMASAFAMLFALMPGMGEAKAMGSGEGQPKSDGDTAKDGNPTEKDGKDVPSDAAALPVMPFAIPTLPVAPPEPVAPPVAASGTSPAPITTLLAAMPTLPEAPPTAIAKPMGLAASTESDPTTKPVAFDPLKGAMPVPATMMVPAADDTDQTTPVQIRLDSPLPTTSLTTGASVSIAAPSTASVRTATLPNAAVPLMPGNTASPTIARDIAPAILRNTTLNAQAETPGDMPVAAVARDAVSNASVSPGADAPPAIPGQAVRNVTTGIPLAIRADAAPTAIPVDATPVVLTTDGERPAIARPDMPLRFTANGASAPVVSPLPIESPAPILQPGQSAPAIQLFGAAMRGEQSFDPRTTDRRKDDAALSVDPTTLTRADSLTAAPVVATTGAEQAPLDMTQHHWPQGMIDRIDRMREDAATADTRIQLSPDALGGIAVNLRQEDGATHIHFTADQAQTASLLADAQPTLARLAEEKGMRLGQTAVDLGQSSMGQSGMGGDRQAPPRRPDPVVPTRPAFAGATASSDAGDPAAASTRIA
ncbi:MAG TPA: flagellar hook-length control protein FliK [Candidatus Sphingomonas excrementigallinarum]|nr:flagellar hook-length control protein FliK [Candidatus Sphingomonas excrementigallinarum]